MRSLKVVAFLTKIKEISSFEVKVSKDISIGFISVSVGNQCVCWIENISLDGSGNLLFGRLTLMDDTELFLKLEEIACGYNIPIEKTNKEMLENSTAWYSD